MRANPDYQPLYELLNAFTTFGTAHEQINHTRVGPIDEVDIEKLDAELFPALFVVPGGMTLDKGEVSFTLEVIVATEQPVSLDARTKVLSNMSVLMRDVISLGHQHVADDSQPLPYRSSLQLPVSCESFSARFDNMLVGWACQLTFEMDSTNSMCLIPD